MLKRSDLHGYQERMIDYIIQKPKCALFCEMGLGKTIASLTAAHDLIFSLSIYKILVIAPLRVAKQTWPTEMKEWGHVKDLTHRVISGTPYTRLKKLEGDEHIHIINRELVSWLVDLMASKKKWPYDMVIIDESSSFKNHSSKRFKSIKRVMRVTDRIVELTGTPATKGLLGLWPQLFILDKGERLGRTVTGFREKYFTPDFWGYSWEPKEGSEKKIQDKISDICLSLSAEDYLEVPEKVENFIEVEMPKKAQERYTELEKEYLTVVNGEDIEAVNAGVKAGKLLQLANGAVYREDGVEWELLHDAKLDALDSVIEEASGAPVIVVYNYRHDLERLLAKYPHGMKLDKKGDMIHDWNLGKIPLLFMHPASGGHGLNMQKGSNILCWFGLNWSLELYQQMNARLHRQGQKKKTFIHHILTKDSVDEVVMEGIRRNDLTQKSLMFALRDKIIQKSA